MGGNLMEGGLLHFSKHKYQKLLIQRYPKESIWNEDTLMDLEIQMFVILSYQTKNLNSYKSIGQVDE